MKRILVLNLGSTSFKFKLYEMGEKENLLATGGVENIGTEGSYKIKADGKEKKDGCFCRTHADALELCMDVLNQLEVPVNMETLDAVGYKAVHGGSVSGSRLIDEALLAEMEKMVPWPRRITRSIWP